MISAGSGAEALSLVVWYPTLKRLGQVNSGPECKNPRKVALKVWAQDCFIARVRQACR